MATKRNASGRVAGEWILWLTPILLSTGLPAQITRIDGGQLRTTPNPQTGSTYTVTSSDCGKLLTLSNPTGVAVSLPQPGANGLSAGCWLEVQNRGVGDVTLAASGSTIDGGATVKLTTNQGLRLFSAGTEYYTQRGQGSGGSGGALAVQSEGAALGTATALNVVGGTGVACIPQINAGVATFQCNADTAYLASKTALQSAANPQLCTSSSASGTVYTASCASVLGGYSAKQTLFWFADAANAAVNPTLNIDTLGPKPLVRHDGTALAVGDVKANTLYRIWYDGTSIRVVEAGLAPAAGTSSGAASSRGLYASRGICGLAQTGYLFYSTDIAHHSQCDGSSWADFYEGRPASMPGNAGFSTLNGTNATIVSNGIVTISAVATDSTRLIGQEVAAPSGSWTVIARLEPNDQGVVNLTSPGRVLYVRDSTDKIVALYTQSVLYYGHQIRWAHISAPEGGAVTPVYTLSATAHFVPYLRIRYDGANYTFSGCTTYSAATQGGANHFGGGNCETYWSEAANAYIGAPAAVGWGLDTHSGGAGSAVNSLTAVHWQVTN